MVNGTYENKTTHEIQYDLFDHQYAGVLKITSELQNVVVGEAHIKNINSFEIGMGNA